MDLKQLQAIGGFVPRSLVKKEIPITRPALLPPEEWGDPDVPERGEGVVNETLTTFIRRRSSADFLEIIEASSHADKMLIAVQLSVCDEEGRPVFSTLDQVRQLAPWLSIPLINAVNEVNTFGEKKSVPRMSSGSGSRSPSAHRASRPAKKRSPKKKGRSG